MSLCSAGFAAGSGQKKATVRLRTDLPLLRTGIEDAMRSMQRKERGMRGMLGKRTISNQLPKRFFTAS
jgi:hypothetical protein